MEGRPANNTYIPEPPGHSVMRGSRGYNRDLSIYLVLPTTILKSKDQHRSRQGATIADLEPHGMQPKSKHEQRNKSINAEITDRAAISI